jgi:hypothetical protein
MPRRRPDETHEKRDDGEPVTSPPFPPEAYTYDSDVTDEATRRVQAEADKILNKENWVVIDGDDKR